MTEQKFYIEGMGLDQFTADDLLAMFSDEEWELQYRNRDDDLVISTRFNKTEYRFIFAQYYRNPSGTLSFSNGKRTIKEIYPVL